MHGPITVELENMRSKNFEGISGWHKDNEAGH